MISFLAEGGATLPPTPPPAQNNFGDTLSDGVAGPTALLIIVLLAIATVLLIRNMNSRLRRLPAEFPLPAGSAPAGSASGPPPAAEAATAGAAEAARSADTAARSAATEPAASDESRTG